MDTHATLDTVPDPDTALDLSTASAYEHGSSLYIVHAPDIALVPV